MKTPDYSTFVVVGGSRGCGKTLDELVNAHKRNYQLESTISQVSKALCGKENATPDELLKAADQLKSVIEIVRAERDATNKDRIDLAIRLAQAEKEREAALLKEKPTKVEHRATLYRCGTCPSCGNVVSEHERWGESIVRIETEYCKFCGQHLDWSGFSETPPSMKKD